MTKSTVYAFMDENNPSYIRLLWLFVYVALLGLTIFLVLSLWDQFLLNPTVTTLESTTFPVSEVPFPGVSFCEMNKISRAKAAKYARHMADHSSLNETEIFEGMVLFGKLYDFDYDDKYNDVTLKLQAVLDEMDEDLISVLKELAVDCKDMLLECRWKEKKVSCSELFELRRTYNGFCCIFNYVKKSYHFSLEIVLKEPHKGEEGIGGGLTVFVNQNKDDYFYTALSSTGITIQIFQPGNYPDQPSGALTEVIVENNTENFLKIVPTTVFAVDEVMSYSPDKRGCLFDEERPLKLGGFYSQSDCNVECRITSIVDLCHCVPFMMPLSTKETVCTLSDLHCLNTYKNKWNFLFPENDNTGHLQQEKQNALRCKELCYPSCNGTSYEVLLDSAPFHKRLSKVHENKSSVHLYYAQRFSKLYKQDVVYYWFEILSNFGGTFGIIIGLSLVSLIECGLFWFQFMKAKLQN